MGEREFTRLMAERANAHLDAMRGMSDKSAIAYVLRIVANNDLVVGVWQEPGEPYGVGIHPIKGRLETVKVSGVPEDLHCDGFPAWRKSRRSVPNDIRRIWR